MYQVTADEVADYILRFAHAKGDLITNLKLQKLIYYAQAWYLALYDKPLFQEPLEAWVHGPVQPALYRRFKKYAWNPIEHDTQKPKLSERVEEHLSEIMAVFGDYSAYTLERMVHSEEPWIKARKGLALDEPSTTEIAIEDMKQYYRALSDAKNKATNQGE